MDRNKLNALLCAILTTLAETPGGWSPRTMIMLGCGLDFAGYTTIEAIMVRGELVSATSEVITITPKGRALAAKVTAHVAAQRGA